MKIGIYLIFLIFGLSLKSVYGDGEYGFTDDEFGVDSDDCTSENGCNNERSQSISSSYDDDFYGGKSNEKLLKNSKLISPKPAVTRSALYVSPEELEHSFIRHRRKTKESADAKEDYESSYRDFISEHFPQRSNSNKKTGSYTSASDVEDVPQKDKSGFGFLYKYPSDEYERIKDLSDQQAKEIQKTKGNCKIVEKDKMVCHICSDPKSGAKSESCSYSSKPDNKKYAYLREKHYNSKDDENAQETTEAPKKSAPLKQSPKLRSTTTPTRTTKLRTVKPKRTQPKRKTEDYKSAESRPQRDVVGLDPFLYGSPADNKQPRGKPKTFEQYYTHVFPKKSSEDYKEGQYEFVPKYNTKSDVDTVLAEFKKKDWSACKRVDKEKLTCYQCKDKDGVNYEECMYISDADPKSSRLVYEESKRFYETGKPSENDKKGNDKVKDRVIEAIPSSNFEEEDEDDEEAEESSASYTTVRSTTTIKNKNKKLIVKKRKAKKHNDDSDIKPEDNDENESEKRTIKRTVKIQESDNFDPDTSRSIRYEQSVSHSSI